MFHTSLPQEMQPQHRRRRRSGAATIVRHLRAVCPTSGKDRFRDRSQATDALTGARHRRAWELTHTGETTRDEVRIYRCDDCNGGWHLTSSPPRVARPTLAVVEPTTLASAVRAAAAIHAVARAAALGRSVEGMVA